MDHSLQELYERAEISYETAMAYARDTSVLRAEQPPPIKP
jgi:Tfp pilus assembly ATPase PilU